MEDKLSFRQKCEIAYNTNNIKCSFETFRNYAMEHDIDRAIHHFLYEYKPRVQRDKSLAQYWRDSGLTCKYDSFKSYVRKHPEMTIEQVICKLNEPKEMPIKQIYEINGLSNICSYETFKAYIRNHKDITIEQILYFFKNEYKRVNRVKRDKPLKEIYAESDLICTYEIFKAYVTANKDKSMDDIVNYLKNEYIPRKEIVDNSLSKIYRDNELKCNINYFIRYVKEHPDEDMDSILDKFKQDTKISLASICKREGLSRHCVYSYMKEHPELTIEEVIGIYKEKQKTNELRADLRVVCEQQGIKFNTFWKFKTKHPELTIEEVFGHFNKESIASKCRRLGLSYDSIIDYKKKHPEMDYDSIIELYLQPKEISFAEKCKQARINYPTSNSYRRKHPELTDNEVIIHYRPDCYINIFGELVIPQEDGTEIYLR